MSSSNERLQRIAEALMLKPADALTPAQRTFAIAWELDAEVSAGSLHQYFMNSAGGREAAAALRAIGAEDAAEIVAEAVGAADAPHLDWSDDEQRQDHMGDLDEDIEDELEALDDRLHASAEPLADRLAAFADANPQAFTREALASA
ncbi:DMP19 family protein [Caulobacter sp. KR2-114]|uniref:DMP19 family protein n=1 Tax=Caulobacter sp. KR2-114 TaxID=3400912 RepID=UPI003C0D78DC